MLLQSYFPFLALNRKTIFSEKYSYFLRLLFAFTMIFVFNDGQITEGEKSRNSVKIRNSGIFYIINIMNFSKFAQEINFYLLVGSLHLIHSKLKIFIHSFISSRLPCPMNRALPCPMNRRQVELF